MRRCGALDRALSWCERLLKRAKAEDLRQLKAQEAVLAEREAPNMDIASLIVMIYRNRTQRSF